MSKATELMEKYPITEGKTDENVEAELTKFLADNDKDTIIKISRQVKRLNNEDFEGLVEALKALHEQEDEEDDEDDDEKEKKEKDKE